MEKKVGLKRKLKPTELEPQVKVPVQQAIELAHKGAQQAYASNSAEPWSISERLKNALIGISEKAENAKTGFTNIITGLAIKIARPDLDVRYYKEKMGAPFSFRTISESTVSPFLRDQEFVFAQSGWQTRVFERTEPYTMDYREPIGSIKTEFLTIYDEISTKGADPKSALEYLFYLQMKSRETRSIQLAKPQIQVIQAIVSLFQEHFFYDYSGMKGASRLPVLAVYALYQEVLTQLKRYAGKHLRPLHKHSAADEQTGAIGDVEIEDSDRQIFEAIEIKHDKLIDEIAVNIAARKLAPTPVKRYYILTTHAECRPTPEIQSLLREKLDKTGVQIIINGVLPTLLYYLRLLDDPSRVVANYATLLATDLAIGFEHRAAWNNIATGEQRTTKRRV